MFVLADASGGAFTVTLPEDPDVNTRVAVKKIDNSINIVTVVGYGGDLIDNDSAVYLPRAQAAAHFLWDGFSWQVSAVVVYDTGTTPLFTYRGDYDPATGYFVNDVVYYQGSSYIAINPTTGVNPTPNASSANWGLLALKGTKGDVGAPGSGGGSGGATFTSVHTTTSNYTASASEFVRVDASGGNKTITLPDNPAICSLVAVKKVDTSSNAVTVVGSSGATIDGDPNGVINIPGVGAIFIFNGTNWDIISTVSY